MESLDIHNSGASHFVTSSSTGNIARIYDSLNLQPTENLIKQIRQIYSPDSYVGPALTQVKLQSTNTRGVEYELSAIAYAVDILPFNNRAEIIYD